MIFDDLEPGPIPPELVAELERVLESRGIEKRTNRSAPSFLDTPRGHPLVNRFLALPYVQREQIITALKARPRERGDEQMNTIAYHRAVLQSIARRKLWPRFVELVEAT